MFSFASFRVSAKTDRISARFYLTCATQGTSSKTPTLLWMLHQRGYDIGSLHKRESETERRLRLAQEELAAERSARLAVEESMRRILTGGK